jgi:hypothetical protein
MPRNDSEPSFANEVAEATGLAPLFANGVVDRCCKRAGVAREALLPADLERMLPHLESALLVYKKGGEVMAALDRLKRLVTRGQAPKHSFFQARPGFARRRVALGR